MGMRASRATIVLLLAGLASVGCKSEEHSAPPVPASSDPEGKDLVEGAVVAAFEKGGGVRLYKIKEKQWFPPPLSEELVMIAFREKGRDFAHAAGIFEQRDLTVALPNVRVYRHEFIKRNYRVLTVEPISEAERALKVDDQLPPKISPGEGLSRQNAAKEGS